MARQVLRDVNAQAADNKLPAFKQQRRVRGWRGWRCRGWRGWKYGKLKVAAAPTVAWANRVMAAAEDDGDGNADHGQARRCPESSPRPGSTCSGELFGEEMAAATAVRGDEVPGWRRRRSDHGGVRSPKVMREELSPADSAGRAPRAALSPGGDAAAARTAHAHRGVCAASCPLLRPPRKTSRACRATSSWGRGRRLGSQHGAAPGAAAPARGSGARTRRTQMSSSPLATARRSRRLRRCPRTAPSWPSSRPRRRSRRPFKRSRSVAQPAGRRTQKKTQSAQASAPASVAMPSANDAPSARRRPPRAARARARRCRAARCRPCPRPCRARCCAGSSPPTRALRACCRRRRRSRGTRSRRRAPRPTAARATRRRRRRNHGRAGRAREEQLVPEGENGPKLHPDDRFEKSSSYVVVLRASSRRAAPPQSSTHSPPAALS